MKSDCASISRSARALALALAALCATHAAASAAASEFPPGGISVGFSGGLGLLAMRDVNDGIKAINAATDSLFEQMDSAVEGAVDVRYAVSDRVFIGLEGGYLRGTAKNRSGPGEFEATGIPVQITVGASATTNSSWGFRFLGGIGALINGRFADDAGGELSGTALMVTIGGEGEYRLTRALAVTAVGLARQAKVTRPDNATIDLDFSGGSLRLGLRGYFGGGQP